MSLSDERKNEILEKIKTVPVVEKLQMTTRSLGDGTCTLHIPRYKDYDGIFESFNGGFLSTIADAAACWATMTRTGADMKMATTNIHISFSAPCHTDVLCHAKVIKTGRSLSTVSAELFDENDVLVATAHVTYMLLGKN